MRSNFYCKSRHLQTGEQPEDRKDEAKQKSFMGCAWQRSCIHHVYAKKERLFCVEMPRNGECEKAQSASECLNIRIFAVLGNHQMSHEISEYMLYIARGQDFCDRATSNPRIFHISVFKTHRVPKAWPMSIRGT